MRAIDMSVRVAPVRARRFEPWWLWELSLFKFFIIIIIIIVVLVFRIIIICQVLQFLLHWVFWHAIQVLCLEHDLDRHGGLVVKASAS